MRRNAIIWQLLKYLDKSVSNWMLAVTITGKNHTELFLIHQLRENVTSSVETQMSAVVNMNMIVDVIVYHPVTLISTKWWSLLNGRMAGWMDGWWLIVCDSRYRHITIWTCMSTCTFIMTYFVYGSRYRHITIQKGIFSCSDIHLHPRQSSY